MPISVGQCRAARALLGWTIAELAEAAGVSTMTVNRFESGTAINVASSTALESAILAAGVILIDAGDHASAGGEGARLDR